MANLAIKGHTTRGKEVIEILEMFGGSGSSIEGKATACAYFINDAGTINFTHVNGLPENYRIFTLEGFLEKFPYKVGDRVQHKGATSCGSIYEVEKMHWEKDTVKYTVRLFGCNYKSSTLPAEYLQPYKEETMDKANKAVFDANAQCCDIMNHLIKEETMEEIIKIEIPKGYEFAGVDDNKQQVVFEKIGCQYPKTYEECCEVLFPHSIALGKVLVSGYNCELLKKIGELLICRDAYWKIAGEQIGLGKPWEPDFTNDKPKYCFYVDENVIEYDTVYYINYILAFPTIEMRDAFYENFKDLIEKCKKLL